MNRSVSLIHTSDLHLGEDGNGAARLRAFTRVMDIVLDAAVDGLLIAGDLFDNARVSPQVVDAALMQLARLSIPVCIAPGNHDSLEPPSIYERIDLQEAGEHIRFFSSPEGESVLLEKYSVAVWSKGMSEHSPRFRPLHGYQPHPLARWQVVMAHGHFVTTLEDAGRSSPLFSDELESLQCDYIALGHWHRNASIRLTPPAACYSGSPLGEFSEHGSVNLVRFGVDKDTTVHRIRIPR